MHFQSGIQQLLLAAEMVMESGLHDTRTASNLAD
jgi:hypothetical protein